MFPTKKCPVCGSIDLTAEKRLEGITKCNNCLYSGKHSSFSVKIDDGGLVPHISHNDIRKELGMWSRSARQMMRQYVTQQEAQEKALKDNIEDFKVLTKLYGHLAELRNDQLKDVPFSKRGSTVELDVHVCKKIEKLHKKLGIPFDEA